MMDEKAVRMLQGWVRRAMQPAIARLNSMINRAVVSMVDDATMAQQLQLRVMRGEVFDDVEHAQPAGVSFVPVDGAEVVLLGVGGRSEYPIAICAQKRGDRPRDMGLEAGEGGLYIAGAYLVFLKSDGTVEMPKGATDLAALASKTDAEIARIWDFLEGGWAPVPNDGGAAIQPAATIARSPVGSVACSKVKIE